MGAAMGSMVKITEKVLKSIARDRNIYWWSSVCIFHRSKKYNK